MGEVLGRPFSLLRGIAGDVIFCLQEALPAALKAFTMLDGREVLQGPARGWGMVLTYFYASLSCGGAYPS